MKYILFIIVFSPSAIQIDRIGFDNMRHCIAVKLQLEDKIIHGGSVEVSAHCIRMF